MDKFWEALGSRLADRWLTVSIAPLLFSVLGVFAYIYSKGTIDALERHAIEIEQQPTWVQIGAIAVGLLVVAIAGSLVEAMAIPVQRILEGYWPHLLDPLSRNLMRRWLSRAMSCEMRWQALAQKLFEDGGSVSQDERREFAELERLLRRIPRERDEIMPTRVGNTLKAAQLRPYAKYGLDPELLWPYLRQLLPEDVRRELERQKGLLSAKVALLLWSGLLLAYAPLTAMVVPIALVLAAYSLFYAVPKQAEQVADLAEATFDLHRSALYRQLRWPLPGSPAEERSTGRMLTTYLARGLYGDEPKFLSGPNG